MRGWDGGGASYQDKTTLLRGMLGLVRAHSVVLECGERDVCGSNAARRKGKVRKGSSRKQQILQQ